MHPRSLSHYFLDRFLSNIRGGHGFEAQARVSELGPAHCCPPLAGAGFVHVRDRDWLPPPHVTEQAPQGPHSDH